MIDRGAVIVARHGRGTYRGPRRMPLDGMTFTGRTGRALGQRYTAGVIAGEGVLEDLDEAVALRDEALRLGIEVETLVFEVPQTPYVPSAGARLPLVELPPVEGLLLLGWDVIEPMEPWDSPLAREVPAATVNANGLLRTRDEAEALAETLNCSGPDDPWVVVRVWAVP